jgi:hypothetical protein
VFAIPAEQRSRRCNEDFAELGDRKFVRGLLPVRIEGGEEFRYGVWLEVDPETFEQVIRVWNDPAAYRSLAFGGRIANALPPFGSCALGAHVDLATRDEKSRPFVVNSREPWLEDLLARGWTHREHLDLAAALPGMTVRKPPSERCATCRGSGRDPKDRDHEKGKRGMRYTTGGRDEPAPCPTCHGTGEAPDDDER